MSKRLSCIWCRPKAAWTAAAWLGLHTYIDRALAGNWGKGDRLYQQGPWQLGSPNQGYQLALSPAELMRAGILQTNAYCSKQYGGKSFDLASEAQREEVLKGLETGSLAFDGGPPSKVFFSMVYQLVMEGIQESGLPPLSRAHLQRLQALHQPGWLGIRAMPVLRLL